MSLIMEIPENKKNSVESVSEYLYLKIYEFFYMVGILFVRQTRGNYHFIIDGTKRLWNYIVNYFVHLYIHVRTYFRNFFLGKYHTLLIYRNAAFNALDEYRNHKENHDTSEKYPIIALVKPWSVFLSKIFCTIFDYFAPILALCILLITLSYFNNLEYGIAVESNGKAIAYIDDEMVYNEAEQIIRNRTSTEVPDIGNFAPQYAIVPIDSEYLTKAEDLANIILKNSGTSVFEGYGFYVDDKFIGSTDEADSLLQILDEYREQYREEGDTESRLQFKQKVSLVKGVFPSSSIMANSEIKNKLNTEIEGEQYYTVEAGDAPLSIADYFDISLKQLYSMNPGIENGDIHVGEELLVSKSVSLLTVTNTKREVYNEPISYSTNYSYSDKYYTTYSKVTKAGVLGEQKVTALVTYEDGVAVSRQILTTEVLTEPIPQEVLRGTKNVIYSVGNAGKSSYGFIWPTNGGYVSCGYLGYKGHTGMDITGCGYGSNIYASAAGTVVTVKWNTTGYGYYVIISHGDGIQTLYAHCSNIYVKVGQYVNQGDVIAAMGSTGNSTGTHLHFEIRINGQYVNPAKYVSK